MPYLTRDNIELYYETHGQTSLPPLLLSHGFSATSSMWKPNIPALSQNYHLIIWDMRGHGRTSYPDDPSAYSEEHTVSDIAALLDHIVGKGSKAIIGGLSLGGYMSLAFYRVYPERVSSLLIIDTGPGFKKDSAREAWNKTANEQAQDFEKHGLSRLQNLSPERARAANEHRDATGLALAAKGMLAQRNNAVIMSLPQVNVPSLIVVGSEDKPFIAASDYMTRVIKGAKKVIIDGAGHASNIDRPKEFDEAILGFLKDLGGSQSKL